MQRTGKSLYFTTSKGKIVHFEDKNSAESIIEAEVRANKVKTVVRVVVPSVFDTYADDPRFIEIIRDSMCAHTKGHEANSFSDLRSDLTLKYPDFYKKIKERWETASNLLTGCKSKEQKHKQHGGTGKMTFHKEENRWYEHTASSY
jgi:hypothetical protein